MYAYIKDGVLDSYSEEFFPKPVPATEITVTLEAEDGTKTENVETVPEVPGIVYDESIEFDFDETPVYEDGKIVPYSESRKKAEEDAEAEAKAEADRAIRKKEILATVGILSNERAGLVALGFEATDAEISDIDAKVAELREEFANIR